MTRWAAGTALLLAALLGAPGCETILGDIHVCARGECQCFDDSDCGEQNECAAPKCTDHVCDGGFVPRGSSCVYAHSCAAMPCPGFCDGAGHCDECRVVEDCWEQPSACRFVTCVDGRCETKLPGNDVACSTGFCGGDGFCHCVHAGKACASANACCSGSCVSGVCGCIASGHLCETDLDCCSGKCAGICTD